MSATRTHTRVVASGGLAVILVMTFNHMINDSFTALLNPLLPRIRDLYGVSIAQTGILVAILSFVGSMLQPVWGIVGDYVDRRVLAAAGPVLTAIGMTTIGYAPNFALLGVLVMVGGVGSALFHPSGVGYVATASRIDQRGLWAAIFSAGGTAGMAIGPLVASALDVHALPWLIPAGVAMGLLSFAIAPSTRGGQTRRRFADYAQVFRGPIRILWGMSVLRSVSTVSFQSLIGFILTNRNFVGHIGPTLAVFSFASALGGIFGGRLSDRLGRTTVLRSSILISIPIFIGVVYSSPNQWWYYPLTALAGALVNANIPVAVVAAQEYAPAHVATASAMMMGFSWGTAGVLFPLVGKLADLTTPSIALSASILVMLPAFVLTLRLPEPERAAIE